MFNPFLNAHKAAIILSYSSNASEMAYRNNSHSEKTQQKENFFKLLDKEFNRQREQQVKETFELVA